MHHEVTPSWAGECATEPAAKSGPLSTRSKLGPSRSARDRPGSQHSSRASIERPTTHASYSLVEASTTCSTCSTLGSLAASTWWSKAEVTFARMARWAPMGTPGRATRCGVHLVGSLAHRSVGLAVALAGSCQGEGTQDLDERLVEAGRALRRHPTLDGACPAGTLVRSRGPKRLAEPTQCTPPACSGVRGSLGQLLGACRRVTSPEVVS